MKKFVSVFLCLCLALTMLSTGIVTAFAEEPPVTDTPVVDTPEGDTPEEDTPAEGTPIEGTEVTWSFNEETGELAFGGVGSIPDYDTYKNELDEIDTVYPWSDVAYTSIVFGEGITGIGNYAFCYSPSLVSVEIPATVTALGKGIFYSCAALTTVTVPATEIPESMFSLCDALENVTLSDGVESIGKDAFYRCISLEAITLPATLKTIGESAFEYCTSLRSVIVPEGVTAINERAFFRCEKLAEITLPSTLEAIGASTFDACRALKSIVIPELITTIPTDLCNGCRALESVTLPSGIKVIESGAFALCDVLSAITIPASVNVIGEKAVGYGKWNVPVEGFTITGYENSPAKDYADANGFAFVSLGFITSGVCGEGVTWEYNEETKILSINGTGAMEDFSKEAPARFAAIPYESVEIADTVTRIGAYAFYNSIVTDFALSENITEIGEKAIGYYADENGEDAVDIVVSITAYEDTAAQAYATDNGIAFVSLGKKLITEGALGENVVWNYDEETKTLTVSGTGTTDDYTAETPAEFADYEIESVVVEDGVTAIGDYALYTTAPYNKISLGKDITAIGEKSFGFVKTEILDEEMNPTGEFKIVPNAELEVTGYLATPADEYSRAFGFAFLPLDAEICQDFFLGAPSTVDHVNKYIYLYVNEPEAETLFGTIDTEKFEATLPELIATGSVLSLTDEIGTVDYSLVIYGDTNLDGRTNSVDALTVLMNSVNLIEFENECQAIASDINHDGRVNSIDALIILQLNVEAAHIEDYYNPGLMR